MKSNKIYFVEFINKIETGDVDDFSHPLYGDLTNCLSEHEHQYLGFTNNEDLFINLPDFQVKKVLDVFSKHNFDYKVSDVTDKVILGDIQKQYPEVEDLTPMIFQNFRIENTSIDDVLDKINEKGISSLDEIDKQILESIK